MNSYNFQAASRATPAAEKSNYTQLAYDRTVEKKKKQRIQNLMPSLGRLTKAFVRKNKSHKKRG